MAVKLTVNLPDDTVEAIKKISEENNITMTEAIRQVIDNQAFLHDQIKNGNKLLLEKNKNLRQVILSTARQS
jgi:predicted transcriptional regulator